MHYIPCGQFLGRNKGKDLMKIGLGSGIVGQPHVLEAYPVGGPVSMRSKKRGCSMGTSPRIATTHSLLPSTSIALGNANIAWPSNSPIRTLVGEDLSIAACARARRCHHFVSGLGNHEVLATCNYWKRTMCTGSVAVKKWQEEFPSLHREMRLPFTSHRSTEWILAVGRVYASATFANKLETCKLKLEPFCEKPQRLKTDLCDIPLLEE